VRDELAETPARPGQDDALAADVPDDRKLVRYLDPLRHSTTVT
jgi:hypothetical protein